MSHSLAITKEESNTEIAERFTLDKGAHVGNFLHAALEYIEFDRFNDPSIVHDLSIYMTQFGVSGYNDPNRVHAYRRWLNDVVNTPYLGDLSLRQLDPSDRLAEMEFNLPIQDDLQAAQLNRLIHSYLDHPLSFDSVRGHLKGYIDLSFRHDGKYYVADYKSNYLGDQFDLYDQAHLEVAVRASGYTLQFLIYALAMHRHLAARLANYHYEHDFGGVYYFYLRGMTAERSTGIYFYKPPYELIESLDRLFGKGARHDD
jgi:exodeoxyribonuclease V beta subunit